MVSNSRGKKLQHRKDEVEREQGKHGLKQARETLMNSKTQACCRDEVREGDREMG